LSNKVLLGSEQVFLPNGITCVIQLLWNSNWR